MRFVHYYPRALVGDGGPTRAMWAWASATRSAGHDVAVVYDAELHASSPLRDPGVPVVPVRHAGVGRLRLPRRLGAVLMPADVLVLHSAYIPGNMAAAWSASRRRIPYVVVPHGAYNGRARGRRHRRKAVWQPVERAYLERALGVHVFFENEMEDVREVAPGARSIVAPTGFALPPGRWDGGTGGYLAWLGRYDIQTKGLDLLIQAVTRLPAADRRPLRTHGRPSEDSAAALRRVAEASGSSDLVTIGEEVSEGEKVAFLVRAAAYVHPSRWESHSLGLVEAMAYGIPSVVSARCVIAPQLQVCDAAVVVEPTPAAIACGISEVLRRPQYYSERAVDYVRSHLTWEAVVREYVGQVEGLLPARPAPIAGSGTVEARRSPSDNRREVNTP